MRSYSSGETGASWASARPISFFSWTSATCGAWADYCKNLPPGCGVFVQAACTAKGETPDCYETLFTQTWCKAQSGETYAPTYTLKSWRPCHHFPAEPQELSIGSTPLILLGGSTARQSHWGFFGVFVGAVVFENSSSILQAVNPSLCSRLWLPPCWSLGKACSGPAAEQVPYGVGKVDASAFLGDRNSTETRGSRYLLLCP